VAAPAQTPFDAIPPQLSGRVALSRAEVAATLGRSTAFVDSLIADGTLRSKRVRNTVFVITADVWQMLGITGQDSEPLSEKADSFLRRIA
jgi:hypothetical protein